MEKYEPLGVVGEGSYGVVLKCKCREDGKTVAIKKFIDSEDDQNVRKIALREIKVLRKLRHENLVNLLEVFRRRKHIYLVFEFIDHTLLDELEQQSHGLDANTCRKYIYQILRGLNFCHENNIIHRDVKPENVLVSKNGIVKLCDFGFARNMVGPGEIFTDYVATRWYRAPELLVMDAAYGKEVDVWALGCLFAEMTNGEPLWPGDSDIDQLFLIAQCLGRLCKRHLNIMQRNSAFSGFRFPESQSRLASTASSASTKVNGANDNGSNKASTMTHSTLNNASADGKIFSESNNGILNFQNGNGRSTSRKERLAPVHRSVFSSMFPTWSDEAVQFLTLCLDPDPAGRPSCNSLMRLPYFTQDNFPSIFLSELNEKLKLEGHPTTSVFSAKNQLTVPSILPSGNVSISGKSNSSTPINISNLHKNNELHPTGPNLNQPESTESPSLTHVNKVVDNNHASRNQTQTSNMTNFQTSSVETTSNFPTQNKSQPPRRQAHPKNILQSTKKLEPRGGGKDNSFPYQRFGKGHQMKSPASLINEIASFNHKSGPCINPESSLAISGDKSRIPILLRRKFSDDSLTSSTGSLSTSSNTTQNTESLTASKSTSNLTDESVTSTISSTSSTILAKERKISIQISTGLFQPYQSLSPPSQGQPKKYSFSFPPPPNAIPSAGDDRKIGTEEMRTPDMSAIKQNPSTQLPLGALTLGWNSGDAGLSQSLTKSPNNIGSCSLSSNSSNNFISSGNPTKTFSTYQKKASPTTITKQETFSVQNSGYFLKPSDHRGTGFHNQSGRGSSIKRNPSQLNMFTYQNSMGNSKSLPVTIFDSSMLRKANHANGNLNSVTESFLPRMMSKNSSMGNTKVGNGSDENNVGAYLANGSPQKQASSALMHKREKWDRNSKSGRRFSVINPTNIEGN